MFEFIAQVSNHTINYGSVLAGVDAQGLQRHSIHLSSQKYFFSLKTLPALSLHL